MASPPFPEPQPTRGSGWRRRIASIKGILTIPISLPTYLREPLQRTYLREPHGGGGGDLSSEKALLHPSLFPSTDPNTNSVTE